MHFVSSMAGATVSDLTCGTQEESRIVRRTRKKMSLRIDIAHKDLKYSVLRDFIFSTLENEIEITIVRCLVLKSWSAEFS